MRLACCATTPARAHEDAWELLKRLYMEQTGRQLPSVEIGQFGRPYFRDNHCYFSISHTHRHAFCAIADDPIGIDAEEADRPVNLRVADRILSPEEMAQFAEAADKPRALLTFWVLKEAAVKLTGEGLRGFPNETDFSLFDPRVREWDGCLVAVLTEGMEGETRHAF